MTPSMAFKLSKRQKHGTLRALKLYSDNLTDFSSNDTLGLSKMLSFNGSPGSTGSRLLTGNSRLHEDLENWIAHFHEAESAVLFNCGYMANLGLLSAVLSVGDVVFADAEAHTSIRDGIKLSGAKSISFKHNDLNHLENLLKTHLSIRNKFVCAESIYSCDGSYAPLVELTQLCHKYGAHIILDEAHATGVWGPKGSGRAQMLGIHDSLFARVHTFGKALGAQGAVVVCSKELKDYLVNFSRPFIYTTALPSAMLEAIWKGYHYISTANAEREGIRTLISTFQDLSSSTELPFYPSHTHIQALKIQGNRLSEYLRNEGLDVRHMRFPTVPKHSERLRICLHSFNTIQELETLFQKIQEGYYAKAI